MTIRPARTGELPSLVRKSRLALESELNALRSTVEEITGAPQFGCPFLADGEASAVTDEQTHAARGELRDWTLHGARLLHVGAYDHLASLARLLGSDGTMSLFAHSTMSRVICEAAIRLAWMIDSEVTHSERLSRGAASLYASVENRLKHAGRATTHLPAALRQHMLDTCRTDLDHLVTVIQAAGLALGRNDNGRVVRVEDPATGGRTPINLNITDQMSRRLPESPGWYGISSGSAHSTIWLLHSAVTSRPEEELTLTPDLLEVGAAAESAISASALIIRTFAAYFGHDPTARSRKSRSRRGMLDALMREYATTRSSLPAGSRDQPAHDGSEPSHP
jgi:hypothetical protein